MMMFLMLIIFLVLMLIGTALIFSGRRKKDEQG